MEDEGKKDTEETPEYQDQGGKNTPKMDNEEVVKEENMEERKEIDERQELERLEQEKEKIESEKEIEKEKVAKLAEEMKNIDQLAENAKETAEDLVKSYDRKEQDQKNLAEGRSKRDLEVKELSQQMGTIKETRGEGDPELKALEVKLNELQKQDEEDYEQEKDISDRKEKLEKLMLEHAESMAEIEAKKKEIEGQILMLALQRKRREEEEKKILARIAELKGAVPPGEGRDELADTEVDLKRNEVSYPLNDSTVNQLKELAVKAVTAAKSMEKLKKELAELQQRDHLNEDDTKNLALKQNELLFRLAELDAITKRVQYLMGMGETGSSELGPPRKFKFSLDFGERPGTSSQSRRLSRPEDLPQVVLCGRDAQYPQLVVCEPPDYRDFQERLLRNGRLNAGAVVQQEMLRRPYSQGSINYPGANVFGPMRQGERMVMNSPYYETGMMRPFGPSNMTMPLTSWMITSKIGYTIGPMQGVQSTIGMPQPVMHSGILQSTSVGSFIPCPCICPKKHKKRKNRKVPQQVYSCPTVTSYPWNYKGTQFRKL